MNNRISISLCWLVLMAAGTSCNGKNPDGATPVPADQTDEHDFHGGGRPCRPWRRRRTV